MLLMFVWRNRVLRFASMPLGALMLAGVAYVSLQAAPPAPVMNAAVVVGPNVTLSWSGVGATSYRLAVGLAPGQELYTLNVGNTTSVQATAPLVATYYIRAYAIDATGESPASNEITVQVTSLVSPPASPTGLAATLNGTSVILTWALGAGGGTPAGLILYAGSTPGGSQIGVFPIPVGTQLAVNNVPAGTYYLRIAAVNQAGISAPSAEMVMVMPVGGGCTPPPSRQLNTFVFSRFVRFSWDHVPGAAGYRLDFRGQSGGPIIASMPVGGNTNVVSVTGAPLGVFYGTVTAAFTCGAQTTGPETVITIDGNPPPNRPRTPNPPGPTPPHYLPLPNRASVVDELARQYPGELQGSCKEHGGNNRFLFRLVERLRMEDTRWGLNWKRAVVGDMSQDVITYNYGSDPDEGTFWVHAVDVIAGHCGSNPGPSWNDITVLYSTGARWTLIPYLDAGWTP
jgi:hypothetical protein